MCLFVSCLIYTHFVCPCSFVYNCGLGEDIILQLALSCYISVASSLLPSIYGWTKMELMRNKGCLSVGWVTYSNAPLSVMLGDFCPCNRQSEKDICSPFFLLLRNAKEFNPIQKQRITLPLVVRSTKLISTDMYWHTRNQTIKDVCQFWFLMSSLSPFRYPRTCCKSRIVSTVLQRLSVDQIHLLDSL